MTAGFSLQGAIKPAVIDRRYSLFRTRPDSFKTGASATTRSTNFHCTCVKFVDALLVKLNLMFNSWIGPVLAKANSARGNS